MRDRRGLLRPLFWVCGKWVEEDRSAAAVECARAQCARATSCFNKVVCTTAIVSGGLLVVDQKINEEETQFGTNLREMLGHRAAHNQTPPGASILAIPCSRLPK